MTDRDRDRDSRNLERIADALEALVLACARARLIETAKPIKQQPRPRPTPQDRQRVASKLKALGGG